MAEGCLSMYEARRSISSYTLPQESYGRLGIPRAQREAGPVGLSRGKQATEFCTNRWPATPGQERGGLLGVPSSETGGFVVQAMKLDLRGRDKVLCGLWLRNEEKTKQRNRLNS